MPSHSPDVDDDDGEASMEEGVDHNNNNNNNNNTMGFDHRNISRNYHHHNNDDGASRFDDSGFDYRIKNHDDIPALNDTHLGLELGYLPASQAAGMPVELIAQLADPDIEEDTEAAEALRANANVKVRKMGKVARSLNVQSVRRFLKAATLRGKSGNRKGKPPRIPPGRTAVEEPDSNIFVVTEEPEEQVSSQEGDDDDNGDDDDDDDDTCSQHGGSVAVSVSVPGMMAHHDDHHQEHLATGNNNHAGAATTTTTTSPLGGQYNTMDMQQHPNAATDPTLPLKTKHPRHSSVIDEAKDIPADVVAATMEAGRKCKSRSIIVCVCVCVCV